MCGTPSHVRIMYSNFSGRTFMGYTENEYNIGDMAIYFDDDNRIIAREGIKS